MAINVQDGTSGQVGLDAKRRDKIKQYRAFIPNAHCSNRYYMFEQRAVKKVRKDNMILIKYKLSDFKRYCPDYSKCYDYEKYINSFHVVRYLLTQNNHNVIEVDFDREDYITWLDKENIEDSYLFQQCWAGKIHKGGNRRQAKKCIICDISFMGRNDSKFCSNICRGKNYRNEQKEKREKERILEAINFANFIGIETPNNKIIDYVNSKPKWNRDELLSINPKNKNYKMMQKKYVKMGIERKIDLLISEQKYIFEKLLL